MNKIEKKKKEKNRMNRREKIAKEKSEWNVGERCEPILILLNVSKIASAYIERRSRKENSINMRARSKNVRKKKYIAKNELNNITTRALCVTDLIGML